MGCHAPQPLSALCIAKDRFILDATAIANPVGLCSYSTYVVAKNPGRALRLRTIRVVSFEKLVDTAHL